MMKSLLTFLVLATAQLFAQSGGLVNGTRGFPQPNDGTTGTVANTLAIVNTSGNAISATTGSTSVPTYVVVGGAGTSGNAVLASNGSLAPCKMDATVGSGAGADYIVASTTVGGDCHAQATSPSSGVWVIGFLHDSNTTAGANAVIEVSGFVFGSSAGVSSFTGDSLLANNVGSTGAVTLTLAQAAAHKVWMNNTGSLTAPGYESLGVADLPTGIPNANLANSSLTLNTSAPLGGGGSVSLGSTLTLTCATCTTDFSGGISAKVANYTLATIDDGKLVTFNGASLTATLPASPPSATWSAIILNLASTNVTVSRNTLQVNGGTSNPSLPQFQALRVWTDGTNYFTDSVPTAVSAPITLTATSAGISIGCNTCGVTSSGLNQFAATTSAQLATVLSDELGSGKVVFAASLQGTDANVLTAGTVAGTGATLCTDVNGGATTTSCTSATPMTTLGDTIYENATPAPARLAGPTTPNGVPEVLTSIPSAGAAVAPIWNLPGISGRAITGTTATDTVASTDCSPLRIEYIGSVAVAVTLPTATTLAVPKCVFELTNNLSTVNDLTVTPTTWTVNGGASILVHNGQIAKFYVDQNSATNWVADITEQGLTAGTNITFTRSATGLSIAASGGGGGTPCTVTALALQFNNAGAFGCVTPFTFASNTITAAAAGIFDLSAATGASAFKVPVQAGATAASDGVIDYDSTAKITHVRTNAADSDVLATTATDTTTTHAVFASATVGLYTSRAIATGDLPAIPLSGLATQAANTVVANVTGSTALPIAVAIPGCSTDIFSNVNYTSGTGFGCNSIVLSAINPQTATYQVLASDFSLYKTITVASGTFTITLVASGSQPAAGKYINILNYGSGTVTVARSGQNINGAAANFTLNPGSASAPTSATISSNGTDYFAGIDEGTVGTVTSVATAGPITGGTITGAGTIACATCVTSAAALTNNALVIGGGLQAASTIAASTTTTQALFATAGAPAFRALANTDLPAIAFDKSATGLANPTADATFTEPSGSTVGWTLNGTAPASVATATGTNASSILVVTAPVGGADSNATGTAGVGGSPAITAGAGGAGTGTNAVGGAGGSVTLTAGNGGASLGTGVNANGGNIVVLPGTAGSGGSGTAGKAGAFQVGSSAPAPVIGTAGGGMIAEGTAPTGLSANDAWYGNATNHCLSVVNQTTDVGCAVAVGQANTYGNFLQDFSGSTIRVPTLVAGVANIAGTFQAGADATTTGATAAITLRGEDVTGGSTASIGGGAATLRGGDDASTGNSNAGGAVTVRGGDATGGTGTTDTGGTITERGGNCTSTTGSCTPGAVSVTAGGFTAAFTNGAASDTTIAAGLGTGNAAVSHVKIQSPALSQTSGTTAQTQVTRYVTHVKAGSTTSATATNMFNVALANNQTAGFLITVHVETTQATPHNCSTTETFVAAVQDTGGTVTSQTTAGSIGTICDTGTLTLAAAFSAAAPSVFSVTPSWATIVPTAVTITIQIQNLSQQDVALL